MASLWNLYLFLPISLPLSLHALAVTGKYIKETQQLDKDTQHLTQPSRTRHRSVLTSVNPTSGRQNIDFLSLHSSWPLSPFEDLDGQGVIGEYADLQESTETSVLYPNEKAESAAEDVTSKESASAGEPPHPRTKYQPGETSIGSGFVLQPTQPEENQSLFSGPRDESNYNSLSLHLSGPLPSNGPGQNSTSALFVGPWTSPRSTSPLGSGRWERIPGPSVATQGERQKGTVPATLMGDGTVTMETEKRKHLPFVKTESFHSP